MITQTLNAPSQRTVERAVLAGVPLGVAAALLSVVLFAGEASEFELSVQATVGDEGLGPARVSLSDHSDGTARSRSLTEPVQVLSEVGQHPSLEVGAFGQAEGTIPPFGEDIVFRTVADGDEIEVRLTEADRVTERQPLIARDERMLAMGASSTGETASPLPTLRAVGGLCVVTASCELLIWGPEGVEVSPWVVEGASVEEPATEVGDAFYRMRVVPNSGQVVLRSVGSEEQEYRLDVPVALSSGYARLLGSGQVDLRREVPAEEVIADFFVGERWWRTSSASGSRIAIPELNLTDPSLLEVLRVQVRDESVRQGAAGVRVFISENAPLSIAGLRGALARAELQPDERSEAMLQNAELWAQAAPEAARFVLSQFERSIRGLPGAVYGRPAMLAEAETRHELARWIGGLSILLLGFLAAAYAFGRGVKAQAQSEMLMGVAGQALGDEAQRPYRVGSWWGIFAVSALIMLGFLFVAALYLSRWIV